MSKSAKLVLATLAITLSVVGVTMLLRAYFLTTTETPLAETNDNLPANPVLNVLGVNTNLGATSTVWGESLSTSGLTVAANEAVVVQNGASGQRVIKISAAQSQLALAAVSSRAIDVKFYGGSAFTYVLPLTLTSAAEVWGFDGKALQMLYTAPTGVDITSAIFDPSAKFLYWVEVESGGNSSIYLQTARNEQNLIRTRIFGDLVSLSVYDAASQLIYYKQGNKCFSTHTVRTDTLELPCTQLPQMGVSQNYYTEFGDPTRFRAGSGDKLWRFNYVDKTTQAVLDLQGQQLITASAAAGRFFAAVVQEYTLTSNGQILLANPQIQVGDGAAITMLDMPDGQFADLQLSTGGEVYALSEMDGGAILWRWDTTDAEWGEVQVAGCPQQCELSFFP